MMNALFILETKDRWTAKDWCDYYKLTAEQATPRREERKAYKVGDTRTDECGTWKAVEIESDGAVLWALI